MKNPDAQKRLDELMIAWTDALVAFRKDRNNQELIRLEDETFRAYASHRDNMIRHGLKPKDNSKRSQ